MSCSKAGELDQVPPDDFDRLIIGYGERLRRAIDRFAIVLRDGFVIAKAIEQAPNVQA